MQLKDKIKLFPASPGVYMMKDVQSEVIYVGKAKNLRSRVKSYFQVNSDDRLYRQFLVKRIDDIDFLLTDTEKEALILENNLIKQFKPRFNINLRDDKTFVSIKININKPFPYLRIVRQIKRDGSLYFGPYSSTKSVKETIRYINDVFAIRKCSDTVFRSRKRPCLYYQLGKCLAPCCNLVDDKEYRALIDQIVLVLNGKNSELIGILRMEMGAASISRKFELAAKIRDRIAAIEKTVEKQKIHSMKSGDRDVFGFMANKKEICIQAMFIRSGNLTDVASYTFSTRYNNPSEIFSSFLNQFYDKNNFIPKEIIIPIEIHDRGVLEEFLSESKGNKVKIIRPQRGEKRKILAMAQRNAETILTALGERRVKNRAILESLARALGLKAMPEYIECFDVSNIGGELAVGAMVVFKMGEPCSAEYRRYKIKGVGKSDDYAMMGEMLKRRYVRAQKTNKFPGLIIIDGGKGHLRVAMDILDELGINNVSVIGIAKGSRKNNTIDRIFTPDKAEALELDAQSGLLLFIQRIRDEAHRFANTYHKTLRRKSQFDKIP